MIDSDESIRMIVTCNEIKMEKSYECVIMEVT